MFVSCSFQSTVNLLQCSFIIPVIIFISQKFFFQHLYCFYLSFWTYNNSVNALTPSNSNISVISGSVWLFDFSHYYELHFSGFWECLVFLLGCQPNTWLVVRYCFVSLLYLSFAWYSYLELIWSFYILFLRLLCNMIAQSE